MDGVEFSSNVGAFSPLTITITSYEALQALHDMARVAFQESKSGSAGERMAMAIGNVASKHADLFGANNMETFS